MTPQPPIGSRAAGLHPRITVVRADGVQRDALVSSLAVAHGEVLDLDHRPVVLSAEEITTVAAGFAAERLGERRVALRRLEQELRAALEARDRVAEERDALLVQHQRIDEAHRWCQEVAQRSVALSGAVTAAATQANLRKAEHRAAVDRLERVLEQRSAAAAAIEDADRELADLDGAQLDESGLRRELEVANRDVQDRAAELAAARAELAALDARRDAAMVAAGAAMEEHRRVTGALGAEVVDDTRVRDALRAVEDAAAFGNPTDSAGVSLAEEIAAVEARVAIARAAVPPPPPALVLDAARAELAAAQAALDDLDEASRTQALSPAGRVEIDAAHDAVIEAEERVPRGVSRAAARRRLEQLRAEEQEVLARHGYSSYLDVVLTGGRPGGGGVRLAAEQRLQSAREQFQPLEAAAAGSDELVAARAELSALRARGAELLGVDPGERLVELLEAHPPVPAEPVAELSGALAEVGVRPTATPIVEAATTWLAEQAALQVARRSGRDRLAALETEARRCAHELDRAAGAIEAATAACERSERDLAAARRKVATLEGELTARAGEDARRLQRVAAAEQLRSQVGALQRTLAQAEAEARAGAEALAVAVQAAELVWDRAEADVADVARRLQRLAEEHLDGRFPEVAAPGAVVPGAVAPDPLTAATAVADALVEAGRRVAGSLRGAEQALAERTADAEAVSAAVAGLRAEGSGPSLADRLDAVLRSVTREAPGTVVVLDDTVITIVGDAVADLLDGLVEASADRCIVVLTEAPAVLGWIIGVPPEVGLLASAGALAAPPAAGAAGSGPGSHPADALDTVHDTSDAHPRHRQSAGRPGGRSA